MIGIVVATHGALACELLKTASLFCANQAATAHVNFYFEDSTDDLYQRLQQAIAEVDEEDGVFVFTDLEGGSPTNQATRFILERADVEVIAGVNLPMLLTALMERESTPMQELKQSLLLSSSRSIASINDKTQKRLQKMATQSDMEESL